MLWFCKYLWVLLIFEIVYLVWVYFIIGYGLEWNLKVVIIVNSDVELVIVVVLEINSSIICVLLGK